MAWVRVGTVTAGEDWKTVGNCISSLFRVSYSFPKGAPNRVILGHLRQKWDFQTFDARWYKLYPKARDWEIYELPVPTAFEQSGFVQRQLQVKQAFNWDWTITIEQWI